MTREWGNGLDGLCTTVTAADVAADVQASAPYAEQSEPTDEPIAFRPTREMRRARAQFYAVAKSKHTNLDHGITVDLAMEMVPTCKYLRQWWHNDLFVEWFVNSNTYQQRIDYLIDMQLDNLEEIILNRDGVHSARDQVTAGRQLAEYKKAFIDEDKASKPDIGADMVRALAAKMLSAKRIAASPEPDTVDGDVVSERRVDLPI